MATKLFDSELKIMEILWSEGELPAKCLAEILAEQIGWGKTTTYTVIKKCIEKGALKRIDPGFLCSTLISKEQAQNAETDELINKMYGGAADMLVASILGRKNMSAKEIAGLRQLVENFNSK